MVALLTCSVCGRVNDDLALRCAECKSFLQTKVDALDLFSTAWGIIESPRATFKRIVLARHKNYVFVLSPLLGISLVYAVFWYKGLGGDGPFSTLGTGLVLGIPAGIVFNAIAGFALARLVRIVGGKSTFRNMFAVMAYATVPIVLALLFVFPVEMAAFGEDWFRKTPHPRSLNPLAYDILIGLDAVAFVWSLFLVVGGVGVAASVEPWKAFLLVALLISFGGGALWGLGYL